MTKIATISKEDNVLEENRADSNISQEDPKELQDVEMAPIVDTYLMVFAPSSMKELVSKSLKKTMPNPLGVNNQGIGVNSLRTVIGFLNVLSFIPMRIFPG